MVEASINLLNTSEMPPLRFTGTSTEPLAGTEEITFGGNLSGGGIGPFRPHARINRTAVVITTLRINDFFIV
jgi:hypothetical protein